MIARVIGHVGVVVGINNDRRVGFERSRGRKENLRVSAGVSDSDGTGNLYLRAAGGRHKYGEGIGGVVRIRANGSGVNRFVDDYGDGAVQSDSGGRSGGSKRDDGRARGIGRGRSAGGEGGGSERSHRVAVDVAESADGNGVGRGNGQICGGGEGDAELIGRKRDRSRVCRTEGDGGVRYRRGIELLAEFRGDLRVHRDVDGIVTGADEGDGGRCGVGRAAGREVLGDVLTISNAVLAFIAVEPAIRIE